MSKKADLYFGSTLLCPSTKTISSKTVAIEGEDFFLIENYDQMPPFFMTIVSDVDLWMFISSTGGLTCGRKNAESSLFPYDTDDKIHDSSETTGPHTFLIVTKNEKKYLWHPFSAHQSNVYKITRNLYKNAIGNKIKFEEINHDLGVSYAYTWKSSDVFGFVKESKLVNLSAEAVDIQVLDGIRNILPYGVNTMLQTTRSTLVDGYKRCELDKNVGLGIYTLSSILTDKAEPSESLKATTVWSTGLEVPTYLLSEQQITDFCKNGELVDEADVKGRRGAYYLSGTVQLKGQSTKDWVIVAELNQSASDVEKLICDLQENKDILDVVKTDICKGDNNLKKLVFAADGYQLTANEKAGHRHFSNTLFNIMRGGIYADGYTIDTKDFIQFVEKWDTQVYGSQQAFLVQLPETIVYKTLQEQVTTLGDSDMERLVFEYLPLTYSRRHGDPSRPWNKFNIDIAKEDGSKRLIFEGNWRDIFQNWEALSLSYPGYLESIITKFVNASTADGYNPYRITKDGIDWEVLDPEDPWSNIGYWGDHQLIYLLKLMELSKGYHAEKLNQLLHKEIFVYANVPYRIKGFEALVKDPRNSIIFDEALEETIKNRVKTIGSDGKLILKGATTYKVTLMEKLLVTILAKFSNYIPEGGIWMNTQRPEWNDANNALVGNGLSMVTLYYLHRFQLYMAQLVAETAEESFEISTEVLEMFTATMGVLVESKSLLGQKLSDAQRFQITKALGTIGETYRQGLYTSGFSGDKKQLSKATLKDFIELSLSHLKDSIHKNKREDGLYHAYNLIRFDNDTCSATHLGEMLEGQVAVLSSKALAADDVLEVLKALRNSPLYREDQNSYILYPNKELPKFLEKNLVSEADVSSSVILQVEVESGRTRFIEKDVHGNYHFNGKFRNSEEVVAALRETKEFNEADIQIVGEIFTKLFNHHAFTGRSGTFYKYEGLGSIYWHMVSKLALTTQECFQNASHHDDLTEEAQALMTYYNEIKAGIGLEKSPEAYGAFSTDAYSHTPSFAGVQQPGMTGQVKEDIIARFGELGVKVEKGQIMFEPKLLATSEFLTEATAWVLPIAAETVIPLEANTLGFTFCGVPMIYHLGTEAKLVVTYRTGEAQVFEGAKTLDKTISESIFNRAGTIGQVDVYLAK